MKDEISLLRGQVKTLKSTLGDRKKATISPGIDSLLEAVEVERQKVKRLRNAIKEVAMIEASESGTEDDNQSVRQQSAPLASKRKRKDTESVTHSQAPSDSSLLGTFAQGSRSSITLETDSITTAPSSGSPATPISTFVGDADWNSNKVITHESTTADPDDPSQNALTLLLAQPIQFKEQVIRALTQDVQLYTATPQSDKNPSKDDPLYRSDRTEIMNKLTQDQEAILNRFFDALSPQPAPVCYSLEATTKEDQRPFHGHSRSASIFLVLLSCFVT